MNKNKKVLSLHSAGSLTNYQYPHRQLPPLVRGAFSGVFLAYCMAALVNRADDDACPFAKDAEGAVSAVLSAGWDPPTSGSCAPTSSNSPVATQHNFSTASKQPWRSLRQIGAYFRHSPFGYRMQNYSLSVLFIAFTLGGVSSSCTPKPTPFPEIGRAHV